MCPNYARARVRDRLIRLDGVGNLLLFGEREFSARVWLDPDRLSSLGLTAGDVVSALREQNVQVSGGSLGAPPNRTGSAFQITVTTAGRLQTPDEFGQVIVNSTEDGRIVRVRDVARVEIGARSYNTNSYLNNKPAVAMGVFQRPGSNALATADEIIAVMEELSEDFPPGLEYQVVYNPTEFIAASIDAVYTTILEAVVLVVIVILVFLQNWRMAIIPLVAIPISLIGTFAIMLALGFTLNLLTLFGLILAIGIVVDDAIVVVENVEREYQGGPAPPAGGAAHDGRGFERDRRHDPGPDRGLYPLGLRARHHRAVLHAVRRDDFGGHDYLGADFAQPITGACGGAAETGLRRAFAQPVEPVGRCLRAGLQQGVRSDGGRAMRVSSRSWCGHGRR